MEQTRRFVARCLVAVLVLGGVTIAGDIRPASACSCVGFTDDEASTASIAMPSSATGQSTTPPAFTRPAPDRDDGTGAGSVLLIVVGIGAAIGGAVLVRQARRRRRSQRAEVAS